MNRLTFGGASERMTSEQIARKLMRVRLHLGDRAPFWGYVALTLKPVPVDGLGRFATDGETLWYDPEHVERTDTVTLQADLAEGVMSVCLEHHMRGEGRDAETWQRACGFATYEELRRSGFRPSSGDLFKSEAHNGRTAESVYADLYEEREEQEQEQGSGDSGEEDGDDEGQGSGSEDGDEGDEGDEQGQGEGEGQGEDQGEDQGGGAARALGTPSAGRGCAVVEAQAAGDENARENERRRIDQLVQDASLHAEERSVGSTPAFARSRIEEIKRPRENWRERLAEWLERAFPHDYTMTRPNRRMLAATGFYMPSTLREGMETLWLFSDCSGSVTAPERDAFWSEVVHVAEQIQPERVVVAPVDTVVRPDEVREFVQGEAIDAEDLPVRDGGGTMLGAAIRYVEEHGQDYGGAPAGVIVLTDGFNFDYAHEGNSPFDVGEGGPPYPVLWASTTPLETLRERDSRYVPPYGEFLYLPIREELRASVGRR